MGEVIPLPIGEWIVNGWRIKFVQGFKADGDRQVWVTSPGGRPSLVSLATLGAIAYAWYRNENLLYPPPAQGGEKVLAFLRDCCELGLEEACYKHELRTPSVTKVA